MKGSVRRPVRTSTASPPLLTIVIATALAGAPTCADTLRAQEPLDPAVEFPGAHPFATILGLSDAADLAALPRLRVNPSPLVSVDPQALGVIDRTALTSARVLPSGGVAILDRRARRLLVVGPDGELRADTPVEAERMLGLNRLQLADSERIALWHPRDGVLHLFSTNGEPLETRALESELEGAEHLGLLPVGAAVVRGRRPPEAAPGETRMALATHRVDVIGFGQTWTWAHFEQPNQVLVKGEGGSGNHNTGNIPSRHAHLAGDRLVLSSNGPLFLEVRAPDGSVEGVGGAVVMPADSREQVLNRFVERLAEHADSRAPETFVATDLEEISRSVLGQEVEPLFLLHRPAGDGSLWAGSFATRADWLPHRRAWLVIDPTGQPSAWYDPGDWGPSNVIDAYGDLLLLMAVGDDGQPRLRVHLILR